LKTKYKDIYKDLNLIPNFQKIFQNATLINLYKKPLTLPI
jgi:hypothetical protein